MSDLIGKTLSQYQIIELLVDSSEVSIYKGFQPNMNRYVTVKVLKSQDPATVQAFNQQNGLLAQVQHPNILPIIDSGQAEGVHYRVLRLVDGGTLRDHLFEYADLRKASGLIAGIVDGLEKIHAQGLVHGNLEPGNIYLDEGGRALLTDFGLPKVPGAPLTPYMSPEQTQGSIVDRRTDIYALGVLLYEMLTGETPPAGVVVSPRAKRPDIPETVEKIIFKAMAQNPEARFQSASEFRNALAASLQPVVPPQASVSQPPATPQPAPPPPAPKQTNWAAIVLGILVVILMCVGIALLFNWWNNQEGEAPVEPTSPPAEIEPTEAPPEDTGEPRPTRTPRPTRDPGEPEPPEPEQPIEPPDDGAELPGICNAGGFAGGFIILGSFLMIRRRPTSKRRKG